MLRVDENEVRTLVPDDSRARQHLVLMALTILTQVLLSESLVLRPGEFDSLSRLTVQLDLSLVVGGSEKRSSAP